MSRTTPLAFAYYAEGPEHKDMMEQSIFTLKSCMPEADVRIIDNTALPPCMKSFQDKGRLATSIRLAIPCLKQFSDCKRVCWMDADTEIVSPRIRELASFDMGKRAIAATLDAEPNRSGRTKVLSEKFGCPDRGAYYCAGILLFDMETLNPKGWEFLLGRMANLYATRAADLVYTDQDLLNMCCPIRQLPQNYNVFACWVAHRMEEAENPIVIHYAGLCRYLWEPKITLIQDEGGHDARMA